MRPGPRRPQLSEERYVHVEADAAGGITAEVVEGGGELDAAARHVRVRGRRGERRVRRHLLRRLGNDDVIGRHPAGGDGGLRPGAAFEQAALDEQAIDANTGGHDCAVDA